MDLTSEKIVVVIRSAGERTLNACVELVLREVDPTLLHVVELVPFEEALRASYKIGIQSGAKWMMTLDADVLLRENAIRDFIAEAEKLPESFFHIEGLIFDKITGQYRKAGHRMYRVSKLDEALSMIPADGEVIRPEFTTISRMQQRGYKALESGTVFGIHDFEQYYEDVYRKCLVHSQKHKEWVPKLIDRWKTRATDDTDFIIALRALYDGLVLTTDVKIDKRVYHDAAKIALKDLGLSEKSDFKFAENLTSIVENVLIEEGPVPVVILPKSPDFKPPNRFQRIGSKIKEVGIIRAIFYFSGLVILKIGHFFTNLGSRRV
ncbi:MAG TPA: hypothetical protein DCE78_13450 [Bacteroidetes bacterium]|nr:hypothetical protein [Bacteroidota bacterium]